MAEQKLGLDEREILIGMLETDEDIVAWTTSKPWMTKLKKAKWKVIDTQYYKDKTIYSMTFSAPSNHITFRTLATGVQKRKPMTEEHKRKLQEARIKKAKEV